MVEKFHSIEPNIGKVTISNPPALFQILIGSKRQKLEEMGFAITETKENVIKEEWNGNPVIRSCDWVIKICKDKKELILNGLVDSRYNTGGLPVTTTVKKNEFSQEDLETFFQL